MSDMNNLLREMIFESFREEKIRRNELRQIIHKACSQPHRRNRFYCRTLIWFGDHLVTGGSGIITRVDVNELRQTIHKDCSQPHRRNRFYCRTLIWFGDQMVTWGKGLITRFDAAVDDGTPRIAHW